MTELQSTSAKATRFIGCSRRESNPYSRCRPLRYVQRRGGAHVSIALCAAARLTDPGILALGAALPRPGSEPLRGPFNLKTGRNLKPGRNLLMRQGAKAVRFEAK
jgi:hypothetical protein